MFVGWPQISASVEEYLGWLWDRRAWIAFGGGLVLGCYLSSKRWNHPLIEFNNSYLTNYNNEPYMELKSVLVLGVKVYHASLPMWKDGKGTYTTRI